MKEALSHFLCYFTRPTTKAHEKEDVDDVWADTGLVGVSKNEKINDHIMSLLRY